MEEAAETKDHRLGALERCVPVQAHARPSVSHLPGPSVATFPVTCRMGATTSSKRGKRGIRHGMDFRFMIVIPAFDIRAGLGLLPQPARH